jgi:uncharacterized protein (DUF302 family)
MRSPRRQDREAPEEWRFTMIEDRAAAEADVVTKLSRESVAGTVARLTGMITAKGMRLFAVIDQAAEARQAGLTPRPTTLVIFGSPEAGTPVMAASPLAALDLPLKVLIWPTRARPKSPTTPRPRWLPATTSPRTWPPACLASTASPTR